MTLHPILSVFHSFPAFLRSKLYANLLRDVKPLRVRATDEFLVATPIIALRCLYD